MIPLQLRTNFLTLRQNLKNMNMTLAFLFWYDFLARPYDPTRGQFTVPDQKAEEYYPWNSTPFTGIILLTE